jgi:hypothetical protein
METVIKYGLITFVVSLTLYFLNKGAKDKVVQNENGEFRLKMHKLYLLVGYFCCALGILLFSLLFLINNIKVGALIPIIFMSIMFGGLGFACVLWGKNHYIIFDENQIIVSNVYGKINKILWTEIVSIEFSNTSGLITIKNADGIKIKIQMHLLGLIEFLNIMESKTRWTIKELKLPINR